MAIYKPTDCSPFNGVFDVMDENALPIYLECKIDSANTPVSAYSIEIYNSENKRVFPTADESVENLVTLVSDLKSYTSGEPFNIKAPTNSGYNGTYLKVPFVVKSAVSKSVNTVGCNQVTAGETLKNGGKYYWAITLYQEISKDEEGNIKLPSESKYYDMPVVSGQVIGSNANRLQTELVPQVVDGYQTLSDLVLQDKYVQLYKENNETNGTRTLISSFDYLYGHIMPSKTSINTITDGMVNTSSYLKVFKFGNDPSILGTTDKVDIFYNGEIPKSGTTTNQTTWNWVHSLADASQSYWEEKIKYDGAENKPTAPYLPFGSNGPQISGNERIIFNNCAEKQYNGIFYPNDISVEEVKDKDQVVGYTLKILWNRTTDANNWGSLSNKIVYVNGMSYETAGSYVGTNVQIDAFQQFGTINQTPFSFVPEKPVKLRNKVEATLSTEENVTVDNNQTISVSGGISSISSIVINNNAIPVQNYVFELGSDKITLYGDNYSGTADVYYYAYDENEYKTMFFKNTPPAEGKDGILYIRPSTSIAKDMIFKELTSTIYSRWFRILDFNTDFYYITYKVVYQYNQNNTQTNDAQTEKNDFEIGQRYQIKSFFKKSDYNPFDLYLAPNIAVKISLIGEQGSEIKPDEDDGTYLITGRNISAIATYEQKDYIWWESYQWILYSVNDRWQKAEILQKTEETYSGEIKCDFYGLTGKNENGLSSRYYLTLIIKTNVGAIIEKNLVLIANFQEQQFEGVLAESNFDCDLLAVDINIDVSNNFIVPSFDKKYDTPPEPGEEVGAGQKTYVITPSDSAPIITKFNTSESSAEYKSIQQTMKYEESGSGRVFGFQSYDRAAYLTNKDDPISVENASFPSIDVVEQDMIVEFSTTINPVSTDSVNDKEYVGEIFSIKDVDTENKISLIAPEPIKENGLVNKNRNKFLWKHSGAQTLYMDAYNKNNSTSVAEYWQDNNQYVTVSVYQSDPSPISDPSITNTNMENVKYINDAGNEKDYGFGYEVDKDNNIIFQKGSGHLINPTANIKNGSDFVGFSTYGDVFYSANELSEPEYIAHEIFTKQSAFKDGKYVAGFQCTKKGSGDGPFLSIRGIYASVFTTNDNPAKPYDETKYAETGDLVYPDRAYIVAIGKTSSTDDNPNTIYFQKKSVLLDSNAKIDMGKDFIFYTGHYCTGTLKRTAGTVSINGSVKFSTSMDKGADSPTYSITGLRPIKKYSRQNNERRQLNGKTISVKADVGVGMEVAESSNGYWIQ